MRRIFQCLFLIIVIGLNNVNNLNAYPLFFNDGTLTYGAKQLCKALRIEDKVSNASEFNEFFQKNLLRPKGTERWEEYKSNLKISDDEFSDIIDSCRDLEMFQNIYPMRIAYDFVVIFGSSTNVMELSCRYLKEELMSVIEDNPQMKIYFLTGSRPLHVKIDSEEVMKELESKDLEVTEAEAAKIIWGKVIGMDGIKCTFVNVNPKELHKQEGELKRANTKDTVKRLMNVETLVPGNILAISVNPSICYQDNVFRNVLDECEWFSAGGTLETVGYSLDLFRTYDYVPRRHIVNILLDTIARSAFEEIKQVK